MNELNELIVTADTREEANRKVKTRVSCLEKYITEHGGVFEHAALPNKYGLDYKIEGFYRNVQVNLGIEYKTLPDLISNSSILNTRLASACQEYQDTALFIEMGNYITSSKDGIHAFFVNPAVIDGFIDELMNTAMLEGMIESWTRDGLHIRKFRNEDEFPQYFIDLLGYIVKPFHSGLELSNGNYKSQYLSSLAKLPGIGFKTASKILNSFPNYYWLSSYDVSQLQKVLGNITGRKLHDFLHNHEFETGKWRQTGKLYFDAIPGETTESSQQPQIGQISNDNIQVNTKPLASQENPPDKKISDLNKNKLSDPIENQKFAPSVDRGLLEFIKKKPRTLKDIQKEFPYSPELVLSLLVPLRKENKVWFNSATKTWEYGRDKTPHPVKAEPELDVGV